MSERQESRTIMRERRFVENPRDLGGKEIVRNPDGTIERHERLPYCDACGSPSKEFTICQQCGRKLCTNNGCFVFFRHRCTCIECLGLTLPVSRKDYQVLVAVFNGIRLSQIPKLTNLSTEEVRSSLHHLEDIGIIRREGLSVFERIRVTDEGVEALEVYAGVFKDVLSRFSFNLSSALKKGGRKNNVL